MDQAQSIDPLLVLGSRPSVRRTVQRTRVQRTPPVQRLDRQQDPLGSAKNPFGFGHPLWNVFTTNIIVSEYKEGKEGEI